MLFILGLVLWACGVAVTLGQHTGLNTIGFILVFLGGFFIVVGSPRWK